MTLTSHCVFVVSPENGLNRHHQFGPKSTFPRDDSHSVYHSTFTPFCAMEARIPFQQPPEPTEKPTLLQSVLRKSQDLPKICKMPGE